MSSEARRQEARLQPISPSRVGAGLKGFQHQVFLDSGPLASENVLASGSVMAGALARWAEQLRIHCVTRECRKVWFGVLLEAGQDKSDLVLRLHYCKSKIENGDCWGQGY